MNNSKREFEKVTKNTIWFQVKGTGNPIIGGVFVMKSFFMNGNISHSQFAKIRDSHWKLKRQEIRSVIK